MPSSRRSIDLRLATLSAIGAFVMAACSGGAVVSPSPVSKPSGSAVVATRSNPPVTPTPAVSTAPSGLAPSAAAPIPNGDYLSGYIPKDTAKAMLSDPAIANDLLVTQFLDHTPRRRARGCTSRTAISRRRSSRRPGVSGSGTRNVRVRRRPHDRSPEYACPGQLQVRVHTGRRSADLEGLGRPERRGRPRDRPRHLRGHALHSAALKWVVGVGRPHWRPARSSSSVAAGRRRPRLAGRRTARRRPCRRRSPPSLHSVPISLRHPAPTRSRTMSS